jgi:hypothetical protein
LASTIARERSMIRSAAPRAMNESTSLGALLQIVV